MIKEVMTLTAERLIANATPQQFARMVKRAGLLLVLMGLFPGQIK